MRNLLLLFVVIFAQPALSFERMMRSDCQAAFSQFAEIMSPSDRDLDRIAAMAQSTRVTPSGWCQMRGGDQGFENVRFDLWEWRAEDIRSWVRDGVPPRALQMRLTGLDLDEMQGVGPTRRPSMAIEMTVRQDPSLGVLVVEQLDLYNGAGDRITASVVFEKVYLSSVSMMQVSAGSIALKSVIAEVTFGGDHDDPFGFGLDVTLLGSTQAQQSDVFNVLSGLPDGIASDAARAEATAFVGDLPDPVGTLNIQVGAERPLGVLQFGVAAAMAFDGLDARDPVREGAVAGVLLDGVRIDINWSPAAPRTD